jgi:phosphoglycolate phosphatase-like HAD superfamily hydrolase
MSKEQKLLLFDVDGVLLKEQGYYRTLAVTCAYFYEQQCTQFGIIPPLDRRASAQSLAEVDLLRSVFLTDPLLAFLRNRTLNSNWDKTYAIVLAMRGLSDDQLLAPGLDQFIFAMLVDVKGTGTNYLRALEHKVAVFDQDIFQKVYQVFQQVHLGSWPDTPFLRDGMIQFDETVVDADRLISVLQQLHHRGYRLGIGTGRPLQELLIPFAVHGLMAYFAQTQIVTIDDVRKAENEQGLAPFTLAKPHPYTYLLRAQDYLPEAVYVIGDSVSDQLAASAAGFHFIGVGALASFATHGHKPFAVVENVLHLVPLF